MNTMTKWLALGVFGLSLLLSGSAWAIGGEARIYEDGTEQYSPAGIWYHDGEGTTNASFNLVFGLKELGGQQNAHGLWAGFREVNASGTLFVGEIHSNGPGRLIYPAVAELVAVTQTEVQGQPVKITEFKVQVRDASDSIIKEFRLEWHEPGLPPGGEPVER